jgi:class 3 adenylate cyclase
MIRLRDLGPGIVIAATGLGAGDLIAASVAGAKYGIAIVWAALIGALLKFTLNEGLARWQLATGTTLLEGWVRRLPRFWSLYFFVYLLLWSFIVAGALMAAAGLAVHALVPAVSVKAGGIVQSLLAALLVLFGRYRRPVTEERIFMFLDLRDSTAIAERLGDVRFNALKNDFYHDLSEPVLQTRGRIYEYVGDEVVITWTYRDGLRDGNCVRCFFLIEREVRRSRREYLEHYGVVPAFKAGLHGGPVVTSEIGDLRKGIVHSGDTVNTTARIEALCRPLGHRLLISASLLGQLPPDLALKTEDLGYVPLRGKELRMHLYSILGPQAEDAPEQHGRGTRAPPRLSEAESHGGGHR